MSDPGVLRALPGHQDLLLGQGLRLPQGAQLLVVWAGQLDRCGWEASNGQVNAASTGREKEEEQGFWNSPRRPGASQAPDALGILCHLGKCS